MGKPKNGWFIEKIPIKMGDLGVPPFQEMPIYIYICIYIYKYDGLPKCLFLVLLINRSFLRAASYSVLKL